MVNLLVMIMMTLYNGDTEKSFLRRSHNLHMRNSGAPRTKQIAAIPHTDFFFLFFFFIIFFINCYFFLYYKHTLLILYLHYLNMLGVLQYVTKRLRNNEVNEVTYITMSLTVRN